MEQKYDGNPCAELVLKGRTSNPIQCHKRLGLDVGAGSFSATAKKLLSHLPALRLPSSTPKPYQDNMKSSCNRGNTSIIKRLPPASSLTASLSRFPIRWLIEFEDQLAC